MNSKVKCYFISLIISVFFSFSMSGIVYARSITDSVEIALGSSPDIAAYTASKAGKQSELKEKKSAFFPVFNLDASFERMKVTDFNTRARTTSGSELGYGGDVALKLIQTVFDAGGNINSYRASKKRLEASHYDLLNKSSDIVIQTVLAHLNHLHMQDLEIATKKYLDDLTKYKEKLQFLVDEGASDMAELLQAQEIQAMAQNKLLDYQEQKNIAESEYLQIVGVLPDSEMTISMIDKKAGDMISDNLNAAIETARKKQAILYAASNTLQALDYELKAENSMKYPRIDAELSHYKRDQKDSFGGEVEDSSAIVRMKWNFETGGGQKARISKRKYDREEAKYRKIAIEKELEKQIRQAATKYNIAIDKLTLNSKRKKTNLDIFENYQDQFEGGKRSVLEVINMRNQLYRAENEYITSYYNYYIAQFSFLDAIGILTEALNIKL